MSKPSAGVCLALILVLAVAARAEDGGPELAREVYARSGLPGQIEHQAGSLRAEYDAAMAAVPLQQPVPPLLRDNLDRLLARAFDPATFAEVIVAELNAALDAGDMQALLRWLDSDTGRLFTRLEERAATPEGQAAMDAFTDRLGVEPLAEGRVELLERLDELTGATEAAIDMTLNTLIGVAIASAAVSLQGSPHELDRIIAYIELSRSQVAAEVAPAMLIGMLYTYRDVSDAELEAYLGFASSGAGHRYRLALQIEAPGLPADQASHLAGQGAVRGGVGFRVRWHT